jgi:hypothetical protein
MTNTIEISSVAEFHRNVENTYSMHPMYRGESKSSYVLRSKFGRHADSNDENDLSTEKTTLHEFRRRSLPYLEREPDNEWEWLALAQHHGLATRLLDWTRNPLVAAYFACSGGLEEDAVIYVLDRYELDTAPIDVSPFLITTNHIFSPRLSARRMETQAGLFTVHHAPKSPFEANTLQRWLLKREMLVHLESMIRSYGVDRNLIYPGLESVCDDIHQWWIRD